MALRLHANNFATTTTTTSLSAIGTSVAVTSVTGLPALTGGNFYYLTLTAGTTVEIIKVTSVSTLTLTIVRAQESTTAVIWPAGSIISLNATADSIDRKADLVSPTFTGTVTLPSGQALIAPALGTVASGNISACTSTSMVMVTPVLGTPTSGNLSTCTAYPATSLTGQTVVANGGTGLATATTHLYAPVCTGTTATGAFQIADGGMSNVGYVWTSTGASSLPTWQIASGGGTVTGPVSSTNNGLATWNSTTGTALLDNSSTLVSGVLTLTADAVINTLNVGLGGVTSGTHISTNTALGVGALAATTSSGNSLAVGYNAGLVATSPNHDTFIGALAGVAMTSGDDNTFIGYNAGAKITTPSNNVCIGSDCMSGTSATSAAENVCIGYNAGKGTGSSAVSNCVIIGSQAASGSTSLSQMVAIGYTTFSATSGANNSALGYAAGNAVTSGTDNALFGWSVATIATSSSKMTIMGSNAFSSMGAAGSNSNNTGFGYAVGKSGATGAASITTGSGNTFIGSRASGDAVGCADAIAIGQDAVATTATGSTSGTFGPGLAIGSAAKPVGWRGDGTIIPCTAGAAGFLKTKVNGTQYYVPLLADASTTMSGATDANSNITANNALLGYTTTATAAGTTTLTVASTYQQFFTGSTTQNAKMAVASTLVLGQSHLIVNNSTGIVTVQSSGGNTIVAMAAATQVIVTCILTSGTSAASWDYKYVPNASSITGSGSLVRNTSATLVTPVLGAASATSINFGGASLDTFSGFQTWTPGLTFATPGNLSVSYASQIGYYTRIGNLVTVHFCLVATPTFTTASSYLEITGLPFTINSSSLFFGVGNVINQGLTYSAGWTMITCNANAGNTFLYINGSGSVATQAPMTATNCTTGGSLTLIGTVTYSV